MKNRGVYFLKSEKITYVGSTGDIERRIKEHQDGTTITTKNMGSFTLARWIPCETEQDARELEKKIKKGGHYERWLR